MIAPWFLSKKQIRCSLFWSSNLLLERVDAWFFFMRFTCIRVSFVLFLFSCNVMVNVCGCGFHTFLIQEVKIGQSTLLCAEIMLNVSLFSLYFSHINIRFFICLQLNIYIFLLTNFLRFVIFFRRNERILS